MSEDKRKRPHSDDNIRWLELFYMAGCVEYHIEVEVIQDESGLMTVEEFMDSVERRMAKKMRHLRETGGTAPSDPEGQKGPLD